jgi:hypothetical protein
LSHKTILLYSKYLLKSILFSKHLKFWPEPEHDRNPTQNPTASISKFTKAKDCKREKDRKNDRRHLPPVVFSLSDDSILSDSPDLSLLNDPSDCPLRYYSASTLAIWTIRSTTLLE